LHVPLETTHKEEDFVKSLRERLDRWIVDQSEDQGPALFFTKLPQHLDTVEVTILIVELYKRLDYFPTLLSYESDQDMPQMVPYG
jgi:DNA mismatch repair ATPase MutL